MYYHSSRESDRGDFSYRGWLRFGRDDRRQLSFEFSNNRKYRLCGISIGRGSRSIKASISIPYLPSLHLKLGGVLPSAQPREIGLSFHSNAVWWHIWRDPMGDWHHSIPKWREGSFHFDDVFLGKSVCKRELLEQREITVPMPEKSYPATAKLIMYSWHRARWFTKYIQRVEIEVPEGIPHEGKGENSWDCGIDRTFSITTGECHSIAEGVGKLVANVLNDRVRYGGWSDWNWQKVENDAAPAKSHSIDVNGNCNLGCC